MLAPAKYKLITHMSGSGKSIAYGDMDSLYDLAWYALADKNVVQCEFTNLDTMHIETAKTQRDLTYINYVRTNN